MAILKVVHKNKSQHPRIDPDFQSLIAPLTPEERRQLESNLMAEGCRDALVVWKGILLDGHNRLEICIRLEIPYKTCEIDLPDREAAKLWIEENQVGRRNLSPDQRAAIAYRILERRVAISKKERARKGGLAGGAGRSKISLVAPSSTKLKVIRQREIAAAEHGLSSRSIRAVMEISRSDRTMVDRIVSGELTLRDAQTMVRAEARKAHIESALETNPRGCGIYTGDFLRLDKLIPDGSADLFLCDPPYDEAGFHVYENLAKVALAKLKPGKFCIAYAGGVYLTQIISLMTGYLEFYWLCALRHPGAHPRVWSKKIESGFKPVLILVKPPAPVKPSHEWFCDLVVTNRDKDHHEWGQGVSGFQFFIERFTSANDLIIDPFCGGGSVPIACIATGRRYIATEIDPGVAATARARVAQFQKDKSK